MTTNHNEARHSFLNDKAPKKYHVGYDALKLAAALAVIRYNEGFKPVHNIIQSRSPSNPFIRTKEGFRLLDNKRIMIFKKPSPWTDTLAKEEINQAERREQILKFGDGNSHGRYSLTKSVIEDVDSDSDVQEDSQDDN